MRTVTAHDFDGWRETARRLLEEGVSPGDVMWRDTHDPQHALPLGERTETVATRARQGALVPRRFLELAQDAACHRAPEKWQLLYRVLHRIQHEGRALLDLASDDDVHALSRMAAEVRRDDHKMRAFVRFTPLETDDGPRYVAWYRPDHLIVRRIAPFFADRFQSMRWSILTPDLSLHWDLSHLTFGAGVPLPVDRDEGDVEALWRTYYAATFNPARVNLPATLREMPLRRWAGLPEATLIPSLVTTAHERSVAIGQRPGTTSARSFVPASRDLGALRDAAGRCRGCDLFAPATQVVFGEGPAAARLVLVGEQPGDVEDVRGRPFVGPAGDVLDRALAAAGIDRTQVYVTNAVKHFAFEERGKRRIHRTPRISEVHACRPWLEAELQSVQPRGVVCLGSTAARALLGPQARVMQMRGRALSQTAWAETLVVTVHPSAVLRADDGASYFAMLVADLGVARDALSAPVGHPVRRRE